MTGPTPRPRACPSERHAADNPCAVDCAVCRDECWPDIVKAVNSHDALVAALEAVEWAVPTPDADTDGACPSCYAGKPVRNHKFYVIPAEYHMKNCQLADALEQVK